MSRLTLDEPESDIQPVPERRRGPRHPPNYTADEIASLRIVKCQLRRNFLFCQLSDGNLLCTPLAVSPSLAEAPPWALYQWQVVEEGEAILWNTGILCEHLDLPGLLAQPEALISELPQAT